MNGFDYHFSGELAQKYGLDEAIILHHLAYWVQKNTIDGRNIHDGRVWTFNTQSALSQWFGWWSRRQIQRILKSLEDQGAIIKGSYNTRPMDRTLWYSVADEVLEHYAIPSPPAEEQAAETVPSSARNGALNGTERCNEMHETVPAIPKRIHKEKPKETITDGAGVNQDEQFARFWERYPRKEGKKRAREKWKRLNPDSDLFARIMAGLERSIRSDQWRRGIIPHAVTWLNGERWDDDPPDNGPARPDAPKRIDPGEGYRYV